MKCAVRRTYVRGQRLSDRDIMSAKPVVGELVTFFRLDEMTKETLHIATLTPSGPVDPRLVPDLWRVELAGVSPLGFGLRGLERLQTKRGIVEVLQEWHCEPV